MTKYSLNLLKSFQFMGVLGISITGTSMQLSANTPLPIIFDTDISSDCDDVGALAILNKMADAGDANILACVVNGHDKDKASAAAIDAINTYYGRAHLPIGTYQGPKYPPTSSPYTAHLRDEFPHNALPDDKEPRAVDIYRTSLASASDNSVTIISVGFLINLEELLQSPPDDKSLLSGVDLVKQKVKLLVVMGGEFPKSDPMFGQPGEWNFSYGGGGPETQRAIRLWPTPILFSGFEIGIGIVTGKTLAQAPSSDPVRRAYELYTSFNGRPSWDLTAVLAAVRDANLYWTIESSGTCQVNEDGSNQWISDLNHQHSYIITKVPPVDIAKVLDSILMEPPANNRLLNIPH